MGNLFADAAALGGFVRAAVAIIVVGPVAFGLSLLVRGDLTDSAAVAGLAATIRDAASDIELLQTPHEHKSLSAGCKRRLQVR